MSNTIFIVFAIISLISMGIDGSLITIILTVIISGIVYYFMPKESVTMDDSNVNNGDSND